MQFVRKHSGLIRNYSFIFETSFSERQKEKVIDDFFFLIYIYLILILFPAVIYKDIHILAIIVDNI